MRAQYKTSVRGGAGVFPPRQISHICRRQMSSPPRHLWRGGDRQARGEVIVRSRGSHKREKKSIYTVE